MELHQEAAQKRVLTAGGDRGTTAEPGVGSCHSNQIAFLRGVLRERVHTCATLELPTLVPWITVEGQQRGEDYVRLGQNTLAGQALRHELTRK